MKWLNKFFFIITLPILTIAQTDTLSSYFPILKIPIAANYIATDKLQQIYAVTPTNEIIKYAPDGTELYRFSNNTLGDLTYLDTTDPFNLLLFYTDYQLIVTLDRTLNKTAELSLLDIDALQVRAVGMSNDGNIWLYDPLHFRLRKVNSTGEILAESQNLSLLLPNAPQPTQLIARDNWVYLCDPAQGFLVFNNFGQFQKTIDLKGIAHFQVLNNQLVFQEKERLLVYDQRSFSIHQISLPEGVTVEDQLLIQKNRLLVKKQAQVEVYPINR